MSNTTTPLSLKMDTTLKDYYVKRGVLILKRYHQLINKGYVAREISDIVAKQFNEENPTDNITASVVNGIYYTSTYPYFNDIWEAFRSDLQEKLKSA